VSNDPAEVFTRATHT